MKKHDANDDCANGADTGPHGIGCAQGKRLCGTGKRPHAQEGECQKTPIHSHHSSPLTARARPRQ